MDISFEVDPLFSALIVENDTVKVYVAGHYHNNQLIDVKYDFILKEELSMHFVMNDNKSSLDIFNDGILFVTVNTSFGTVYVPKTRTISTWINIELE